MSGSEASSTKQAAERRGRVPRAARVMRSREDFETALRSGHRIASRNFILRVCPNPGPHARLGIIAGKKAASRAVDRNRAKRLIREVFHAACATLGPHDVTVQLRSDLKGELNSAVREELRSGLETLMRRVSSRRPQPRTHDRQ